MLANKSNCTINEQPNSVVPNAWIAGRLDMGRADCLSRYPKQIDETETQSVVEKRERLRAITKLRVTPLLPE